MTVRELVELNQMITDIQITVRIGGTRLLDQLNIGCHEGVKPPYPTRVPISKKYVNNYSVLDQKMYKDAAYIPKSINSWDDGKDYWQVKVNRIPDKWLDLEVIDWSVSPASTVTHYSPRRSSFSGHGANVNFHGQKLDVNVLPSGENLEIKQKEKPRQQDPNEQLEGQMSIEDWDYEVMEI